VNKDVYKGTNKITRGNTTDRLPSVATNVIKITIPKMADTSQFKRLTSCHCAEEYASSQLRNSIMRTLIKFLLA